MTFEESLKSTRLLESADIDATKKSLWKAYLQKVRSDKPRLKEHEERALTFNDYTMRFHLDRVQDGKQLPLYIALHGGGAAGAKLNDAQYRHMQVYYKEGGEGLYVATRGITNTWNLHFVWGAFPLYDRLIENMIALEGADPNRVYLLGFSAGGDGVYNISTRMADRFAAVNMSAGHHNWTNKKNLYNLPILLQVGEYDSAYDRHKETVKFFKSLLSLQETYQGGYVSELFLHKGKGHHIRDYDPHRASLIIADPVAWLAGDEVESVVRNTAATVWLKHHKRESRPKTVVWHTKTRVYTRNGMGKRGKELWPVKNKALLFYWLELLSNGNENEDWEEIVASLEEENTIKIRTVGVEHFKILLDGDMLDLGKTITIEVNSDSCEVDVKAKVSLLAKTLQERGDINYSFPAAVEVKKLLENQEGEVWSCTGL